MRRTEEGEAAARDAVNSELARRGWTAADLSRESGAHGDTVRDFINGVRWPQTRSLGPIERAFGWEPGSIERIAAGRGSVAVMCPDDDPPEQDSAPVTRTVHLTVTDTDTAGTVNVTVTVTAEQAASMDWSAVVMSAIASLREQRERRSPP